MSICGSRMAKATVSAVVLTLLLAGCGSHLDSRPALEPPPPPSVALSGRSSFTHVVRDVGCNRHVAPIHLKALRQTTDNPIGGTPISIHLHHGPPPAMPGYPHFPRRLGGLPYRGFSLAEGGPEGVFYAKGRVDGRFFDKVLAHGALVVSASGFTPNRDRFLARISASLTRVHVGRSPGWINQTRDWSTPTGVLYREVNWLPHGVVMALDGDRSPARLVSLARSLVC